MFSSMEAGEGQGLPTLMPPRSGQLSHLPEVKRSHNNSYYSLNFFYVQGTVWLSANVDTLCFAIEGLRKDGCLC